MRKIFFIAFILIFLPLPVFADVITTQSMLFLDMPYLLLFIIMAETLALWVIAKFIKKKSLGFGRCLLAVTIANIISAIVGIFIPLGKGQGMAYALLIIGYPLSSVIEAPFIKILAHNKSYSTKEIFKLSFLVNLASYLPLAIWLFIIL